MLKKGNLWKIRGAFLAVALATLISACNSATPPRFVSDSCHLPTPPLKVAPVAEADDPGNQYDTDGMALWVFGFIEQRGAC